MKSPFFHRYEFLIPLLLFAAFVAVSLPGIQWGAPALWNPDELVWRVQSALSGEMVFDVSEPDFNYPSLPKYVMYAIGSLTYGLGYSTFAFIVSARMFSALLGALAAALIYSMARMIGAGRPVAALAGALYIAAGVAAANGRFAHNDLYLQLFAILSVFFVIKYQQTQRLPHLYASFFCVGLAASSKFTGGSLILLPVVMYLSMHRRVIASRWLPMAGILFAGGLVSYVGYGLGTPKAFTDPIHYFSSVIPALRNYPQYGFNSGAQIGLFGQWRVFKGAVGIFAYYLFIFSFIWYAARLWRYASGGREADPARMNGAAVLIAVLLIFDLPFMISINYIERYFIPFVPFLSVLAALCVEEALGMAKAKDLRWFQPALAFLLIAGFVYSALRLGSIALLFLNDSRIPATAYIETIRGYGKSIEYTLYPPAIEKKRFARAHNYPIYFVKYPSDVVPSGGRIIYNEGEEGLLRRDTDYLVIDSYTYKRFYTESVCATNPVECDFFKRLLAGESEHFRLLKQFKYDLPAFLPRVTISAVNPDILIFERVR